MEKIQKRLWSPSELYLQPYSEARHEFKIQYKYEYIHNIDTVGIDYIHINQMDQAGAELCQAQLKKRIAK